MNRPASPLRRVVRNTGFQGLTFGTLALANAVIVIAVGRIAGPDKLGSLSFAITVTLLGSILGDLGISMLLTREASRLREQPESVAVLAGNGLAISTLLGLLMVAAANLVAPFVGVSPESVAGIRIVAVGVGFSALSSILKGVFYAYEKMHYETVYVVLQELVYVVLALFFLGASLPFVWVFWAYSASRLVGLIAAVIIYGRRIGPLRLSFTWPVWRSLIWQGLPFAANSALALIYIRSDVILLGLLAGSVAVGIYEAGAVVGVRANVVARMVTNSMLPSLARDYPAKVSSFETKTVAVMRYLLLIGVPMSIVLATFSSEIIALFYGEQFKASVLIFAILAIIVPLRFLSNVLATGLTASNAQGMRTLAVFVASVINVLLNLLLIPDYSYLGAAISSVATELCLFLILFYFLRGRIRFAIRAAYLRLCVILLIPVCPVALVLCSVLPGWVAASGGVAVYSFVAWQLILTPGERAYLRGAALRCACLLGIGTSGSNPAGGGG
ncbi:MAG: flippase [Anaerolineae bacterium]|nr:flippase [Anaerolineae bacterium]